jgi:hypothetical protein
MNCQAKNSHKSFIYKDLQRFFEQNTFDAGIKVSQKNREV